MAKRSATQGGADIQFNASYLRKKQASQRLIVPKISRSISEYVQRTVLHDDENKDTMECKRNRKRSVWWMDGPVRNASRTANDVWYLPD